MTSHIIAFTAAQPGWRLWLTYGYGEVEEESLAGWVLVAEVKTHPEWGREFPRRELPREEQHEEIGLRVIRPAWFDRENSTLLFEGDACAPGNLAVLVVGPADRVPTAEELAQWAGERAEHMRRRGLVLA
jgi:hypothetical protein